MKKLTFKGYKVIYQKHLSFKNYLVKLKTLPYNSALLGLTTPCHFAGTAARWAHFCGHSSGKRLFND